jgi:hypothetical protein
MQMRKASLGKRDYNLYPCRSFYFEYCGRAIEFYRKSRAERRSALRLYVRPARALLTANRHNAGPLPPL